MKHQPLCPSPHEWLTHCHYCDVILKAYRSGWNDHARTQAMWEATNGGAEVHVHYLQHGDGENP